VEKRKIKNKRVEISTEAEPFREGTKITREADRLL